MKGLGLGVGGGDGRGAVVVAVAGLRCGRKVADWRVCFCDCCCCYLSVDGGQEGRRWFDRGWSLLKVMVDFAVGRMVAVLLWKERGISEGNYRVLEVRN